MWSVQGRITYEVTRWTTKSIISISFVLIHIQDALKLNYLWNYNVSWIQKHAQVIVIYLHKNLLSIPACSNNDRAWAVVPTRAKCVLGTSRTIYHWITSQAGWFLNEIVFFMFSFKVFKNVLHEHEIMCT